MTQATTPFPGWSASQLDTLAQLFAALATPADEGEARRHAELAATALSEVADPADLRQVKLTLSLLGTRWGSLLVAQRGTGEREQLLKAWSTSRLPQRRTFFQLVKRLACFFAYADPGPSGTNPRWPDLGYAFVDEPAAATQPLERGLVQPDTMTSTRLELEAEVVVVGSGAGGGVIAARLAEAGRGVLVVEAAGYLAENDLPRDEVDGFNRLFLDRGLTATADLSVGILAGAAVGGGTMVNWTTCIDPPDGVRHEWAADGLEGFDGPETDRHLARLHEELGYRDPPNIPAKDQLILDGAAALGWEAAPTQRNAADCGDCGACTFGCRRGAKRSGQRLHLAMAVAHGARLLAGARVEAVVVDRGVASGVSGRLVGGRPFRVRAGTVVVAAGAVRTPSLLLRSGLSHPALGVGLHLHPTTVITALMPGAVDIWRGSTQAARSLELLDHGVIIESAPAHPGLIAVATPWHDRAHLAEQMSTVGRSAPLIAIVRDRDAGRVRLTRAGRPRIDYRISDADAATARVGLLAMARIARAGGAQRITALGTPGEVHELEGSTDRDFDRFLDRLATFDFAPNRGTLFSAHQMGTARAGADPRATACDPRGRVRLGTRGGVVRGLYVGDASLFPSAVGVNPMVTVMLMADRVAEALTA